MTWTDEQIKAAYSDFRVFVFMVWKSIGLPNPTTIQYDIANTLQHLPRDRFIIEGFRGVAKSFLTCAYTVWCLWKDPQKKILIVSASKDRADANAVFVKRIIYLLPFLEGLKPQKIQRDTQNLFDVGLAVPDISPSVKSVGITGQITGSRADLLIADDVEVVNNSGTQIQRDKLGEAVKEFDAVIKPGGQILYLGTPQNEMSLYNELTKRGYGRRIWPVLVPRNKEVYGDDLAPIIDAMIPANDTVDYDMPTDPERFDMEEIDKRRLSYGRAGFELQFMLNTNLSDAEKYPLKVKDFIVADLDLKRASLKWDWCTDGSKRLHNIPSVALKGDYFYAPLSHSEETSNYTGTVMAIDPSGRGKDETAYTIIKFLNGYLFVMDIGGYRDGYSESTLSLLANKAKFYDVNDVVVESNFGDGMFSQLLKPVFNKVHPVSITEVNSRAQKEKRIIDTIEPVLMQHKIIINTSVIMDDYRVYENDHNYSFIYQLTRICNEKGALAHDDRLDSFAMAVSYWHDVIDRDSQIGMDEEIEEQLEAWLDPDRGILWMPDMGKDKLNTGHLHLSSLKKFR